MPIHGRFWSLDVCWGDSQRRKRMRLPRFARNDEYFKPDESGSYSNVVIARSETTKQSFAFYDE